MSARSLAAQALRWPAILIAGLILGTATSLADSSIAFGSHEQPWVRAAAIVLNLATTWAALAFLTGRASGTPVGAAVAGTVVLWVAVLGYYAYGGLFGDRADVGWQTLLRAARVWVALADFTGPVFGLLGWWRRHGRQAASAAATTIPLLALAEVFVRIGWSPAELSSDPVIGWTLLGVITLAVTALLAMARTAS